jgi:hypothetical protein
MSFALALSRIVQSIVALRLTLSALSRAMIFNVSSPNTLIALSLISSAL